MPRPRIVWRALPVILFLVALLGFAFGIGPSLLQAPRVETIEPADGSAEILPSSPITITFSAPMDRAETEASIRVTPRRRVRFEWQNDRTLQLVPESTLPISTSITVGISTRARSWMLRPLEQATRSRFTTLMRPYLSSSTPAPDARFVYVGDAFELEFSRAMDPDAVAEALTITPPLFNRSHEWHNRTLTVRGFFRPQTLYQIELGTTASDAEHGILMEKPQTWAFTTATQYPNLSVLEGSRKVVFAKDALRDLPIQFTNVSRLDLEIYGLERETFDNHAAAPFEAWFAFQPSSAPLETLSVLTHAPLDRYMQMAVNLPPLPPGTFLLRVTSPEGVSDRKLLEIE